MAKNKSQYDSTLNLPKTLFETVSYTHLYPTNMKIAEIKKKML